MKKFAVKALFASTFLPYIGLFLQGCYAFGNGFCLLSYTAYGFEGFWFSIRIHSMLLTALGVIPLSLAIQLTFLIRRKTRDTMSDKKSRITTAVSCVLLLMVAAIFSISVMIHIV